MRPECVLIQTINADVSCVPHTGIEPDVTKSTGKKNGHETGGVKGRGTTTMPTQNGRVAYEKRKNRAVE